LLTKLSIQPLVTLITPSYNQAEFLERTIRSVLLQDYPAIEYLIIDGASTDDSLTIIHQYEDKLTDWISEPDQGQGDAINKGFRRARGEIVAWLNSDDLLLAGAVSEAVAALQAASKAGMVYGDGILIDDQDRILDWHPYRQYDVLDLLKFEVLLQPAVFMRREVLEQVGLLNNEYNLVLDHELWVRFAAHAPIIHVPSYWAAERTYPQAKTRALAAGFVEESDKLIEAGKHDPILGPIVEAHFGSINAALDIFAGRRLIDAAQYGRALKTLLRAIPRSPSLVLRYWYKYIQALMGALGMESLFMAYRNVRRRIAHGDSFVVPSENGMVVDRRDMSR
jgi:glycosyltransferase involved in cell wall biosynthesis